MSPLFRKLLRNLREMLGQVITIALVVACGIASFVTMRSAYDSLLRSRDAYYTAYRFADVFAHLERAPHHVVDELEAIPGVAQVYPRVVANAMVPMPGMARPASGTVVSMPEHGEPALNAVHLLRGRELDAGRTDEVLLLEAFAKAHGIEPGDRIPAVVNGTLREFRVVGIGMSPEFVMTMPPGAMTFDPKRVAVMWMPQEGVESAFELSGAFNDVVARLQPGANEAAVLDAIDEALAPYGGLGAVGRSKQASHYMLSSELTQLENMATVVPFIFLFVAAFLLNVVLSRLVTLHRSQIATLKAVGYRDRDVGAHYLMLVSVIVLIGAVIGLALGVYLGHQLLSLYTDEYFRFPSPRYQLDPGVAAFGVLVSLGAAVIGGGAAVRRVARLPPAEAMRPPAPASYRRSLLERMGVFVWLGPATRMILREIQRRPLRLVLSAIGISMAIGIMVVSRFMVDAMDRMLDVQVHRAMREDLSVTLNRPMGTDELDELRGREGVFRVEGMRSVAVRFEGGHHWRDAVIHGYPEDGELQRIVDGDGNVHPPPDGDGLMLTTKLGEILEVGVGDTVYAEVREGDRHTHELVVTDFVDESFGLQGHMNAPALHRLMRESDVVSSILIKVDPLARDDLMEHLKTRPYVLSVSSPRDFREQFDEQSGEMMTVMTLILTTFASIIAIGVIYNNMRVALSQRNRDLASLRVLGYTRGEIARILVGEQAVQVLLAIPIGLVIGRAMVVSMVSGVDPETYRLPIVISPRTYIYASMVALAAAAASALLLRRKLTRLDLIGVLKTRE